MWSSESWYFACNDWPKWGTKLGLSNMCPKDIRSTSSSCPPTATGAAQTLHKRHTKRHSYARAKYQGCESGRQIVWARIAWSRPIANMTVSDNQSWTKPILAPKYNYGKLANHTWWKQGRRVGGSSGEPNCSPFAEMCPDDGKPMAARQQYIVR